MSRQEGYRARLPIRNGRPEHLLPHEWDNLRGRTAAQTAIARAKRRGELPHLNDGKTPCVDCGEPATDYDHRDYNRPLDVEPTCRRCNLLRGPALPAAVA